MEWEVDRRANINGRPPKYPERVWRAVGAASARSDITIRRVRIGCYLLRVRVGTPYTDGGFTRRIGPFETLDAAKVAAELII